MRDRFASITTEDLARAVELLGFYPRGNFADYPPDRKAAAVSALLLVSDTILTRARAWVVGIVWELAIGDVHLFRLTFSVSSFPLRYNCFPR